MKIEQGEKTYQERQIVARIEPMGFTVDGGIRKRIFRYVTIWRGHGVAPVAAIFIGPAKMDKEGMLSTEVLREGDIVLSPGLVYRPLPMSGLLMAEHLKKMRTFRPKEKIVYDKSSAPAIDLGVIKPEGIA